MAYVIWRVVMKKYSRIRLGLTGPGVTPTSGKPVNFDDESWKPSPEETPKEIACSTECRQSKTKRVKNYFKKYRSVLGSTRSASLDVSSTCGDDTEKCPSNLEDQIQVNLYECEVQELEDVYEDANVCSDIGDCSGHLQVANIVEVRGPPDSGGRNDDNASRRNGEAAERDEVGEKGAPVATSPVLHQMQEEEDGGVEGETLGFRERLLSTETVKSDVESLVDKYFGSLYKNYEHSRKCLIRQARNLLVCEYHGCLQRFEDEFCVQAEKLLRYLKNEHSSDSTSPPGWPLCLGPAGVALHLGPLDSSLVRNRDCYLCLRSRSQAGLEVALIWRHQRRIRCHTVAEFRNPLRTLDDVIMCSRMRSPADLELAAYDDYDGSELPQMLQSLLVSVEHALERVPLDDLQFPCPQCLQYLRLDRAGDELGSCGCQCSCRMAEGLADRRDSSMQTSPMFEFVGSIPHIDSDEDDDKDSVGSGSSSKKLEIATPKRIDELPDKLLMSGINLPGTTDTDGRPIILCYAECIARVGLNKYEIAKLLLYYCTIPTPESREKGFTILLLAENETDYKILEILDKSLYLIGNSMTIYRFLVWRPGIKNREEKTLSSRIQVKVLSDESSLYQYISKEQAPADCGGICTHDQLEWVEFFRQMEPFLASCRVAGRNLLSTLSQLRNEEVPQQVTRRFLNHQCRQIKKALESEHMQKLIREGNKTLSSLEERKQWLASSRDVKRSASMSSESFSAVDRVTKRLEQLKLERMDRLKELSKFRSLQDEVDALLSWTRQLGEETLTSLTLLLRSAGDSDAAKDVANEFETFFFNAWRQIEKANDLYEESKNINETRGQPLKELMKDLHIQMKAFREKLEDTRERIEDSCRCFLLLESCQDILEDDSKEQEGFIKMAEKSGNDKLLQICQSAKKKEEIAESTEPPDKVMENPGSPRCSAAEVSASSTPLKALNNQIRRRSVSSLAFIYHCNHHAAGEFCNCYESDTENSVSYRLKKKYIQTLQGCDWADSKDPLERKSSGTLGGIKEERESVENLQKVDLELSDCNKCDSGVSTAENSVGDDIMYTKKKVRRTCSCQYYRESCNLCSTGSSSTGSNQDHTENQHDSLIEEGIDGFLKSNSSDDIDDHFSEERRKVPPVAANNHLYCHASTLDLPSDALYNNMDPKTQKTLTYVIKEMVETERDYVKSLDYIIVNYIPELQREDIPQALRGQRNTVFGNVEKIYEFHSQHFLKELEEVVTNPLQVGQIFLKYDKRFYLYALYNKNKPKSDSLMSEYGTLFFKSKQIELADKMDLASYLLKPVQRMGKYALLLQQMMKACSASFSDACERRIQDIEDLKQAEEMVRFQLRHGNDLLAMDSIRECDVNLKEQGRLIRQNEFLVWEGRSGKKSLRQVFLFEELILFSKARRFPDRKNLDLYIYKNSIKMTDIGLTAKTGDSPKKFEIWFRKRKPNDTFTLQSMTEDVKKIWTEELSQLLWRQAIRNRDVRMAEMSSMGIGNKPCLDIRPSDNQISDRSISFAQLSRTVPRFRNSIVGNMAEVCTKIKRPHSVISMSSSVSSGSSSSSGSGGSSVPIGLAFESACESPKPFHKSATLNSQCSIESGIVTDMSVGSDDFAEQNTGS